MRIEKSTIAAVYLGLALLCLTDAVLTKAGNRMKTFYYPNGESFSVLAKYSERPFKIKDTVYGYLPYWTIDNAKYLPLEKITHISYFALSLDSKGNIEKDEGGYNNWKNNETLHKFISQAQEAGINFGLTVIIHTENELDTFLTCEKCWDKAYENIKAELEEQNLQHLNLDFEYPGYTDEKYRNQYTKFVAFINTRMDEDFKNPMLVVATFADGTDKPRITDPKGLAEHVDALFIMAYDFHSVLSANAGPVAPIDGNYSTTALNLTRMVEEYKKQVEPDKIILGVPFYGYDWVVSSPDPKASRVEGNDSIGYSQARTYAQIKNLMLKYRLNEQWDSVSKTPFISYVDADTGSQRQLYFENARSIKEKDKLAKSSGLKGLGIWALGFEEGYTDLWEAI